MKMMYDRRFSQQILCEKVATRYRSFNRLSRIQPYTKASYMFYRTLHLL